MHPYDEVAPGVRKIAVLRVNGLGDLMFALPALHALRAAYPAAELVLLAGEWQRAFLAGRPGPVDRVVVVPPCRGVGVPPDGPEDDPAALEEFFAAMRRERFDIAVQMHGGGRYSNPFLRRLGARLTAGLKAPDAAPLDRWVPYIYYQPEVLRLLEVASLVGARPVPEYLEPRLAVTAADLDAARRVVPDLPDLPDLGDGRPLVAFHPGAGDPRRRWPAEKFAAVGDALVAADARVVVTGSPGEEGLTAGVVGAMSKPADDLCGRLTLGGLAGLLSRCRVVVSNDSGPLHLAGAVGAATVGVYWCGNLINAGPFTRARHRPALSWRLACPVCGRDTTRERCDHAASFVADVTVDEVVSSALDLLRA